MTYRSFQQKAVHLRPGLWTLVCMAAWLIGGYTTRWLSNRLTVHIPASGTSAAFWLVGVQFGRVLLFGLISATIEWMFLRRFIHLRHWPWLRRHILLYLLLGLILVSMVWSGQHGQTAWWKFILICMSFVGVLKYQTLRDQVGQPVHWTLATSIGVGVAVLILLRPLMRNESQVVVNFTRAAYSQSAPPTLLRPFGQQLVFSGDDGHGGMALWISDGTEAGTHLVQDVNPFDQATTIRQLAVVNDQIFLVAADAHQTSIWHSNGTPDGTQMLVQFAERGRSGESATLVPGEHGTFFSPAGRPEIWYTDGTKSGTRMLTRTSDINLFLAMTIGDTLLFGTAANDSQAQQVWRIDEPSSDTQHVADVALWYQPATWRDGLVFAADDGIHGIELWRSDGSAAGTFMVKDINQQHGQASHSKPYGFAATHAALFFVADDGIHGPELWRSDGTTAGTALVRDVNRGRNGLIAFNGFPPNLLAAADDGVYLAANDGTHGYELWRSDGTAAGTFMVKDIRPHALSSTPTWLTWAADKLFFVADDGSHGVGLWRSDGSAAGTFMVKDINPLNPEFANPYSISDVVAVDSGVFFVADDGVHGPELWRSDGTTAGTFMVKDITP